MLAEGVPHLCHRPHPVIRHGVHQDGSAADAITFVTDLLVAHTLQIAGGFVNVALDGVGRHVGRFGLFNGQTKSWIGTDISPASSSRHHDFSHHPGPDALALFVLPTLAVLNICPFTVASHRDFLEC